MVEDFINTEIAEITLSLQKKKKYLIKAMEGLDVSRASTEYGRWLVAEEKFVVRMFNFVEVLKQFLKTRERIEGDLILSFPDGWPTILEQQRTIEFLKELLNDELETNLQLSQLNQNLCSRLMK